MPPLLKKYAQFRISMFAQYGNFNGNPEDDCEERTNFICEHIKPQMDGYGKYLHAVLNNVGEETEAVIEAFEKDVTAALCETDKELDALFTTILTHGLDLIELTS